MARAEGFQPDRTIPVQVGQIVRLAYPDGMVFEVRKVEGKRPRTSDRHDPDEVRRAQMLAGYPALLDPFVRAKLSWHSYKLHGIDGTDLESADVTVMDAQTEVATWMQEAHEVAVQKEAVVRQTDDYFKAVRIASTKNDELNEVVVDVRTDIYTMIDNYWGGEPALQRKV